MSDRVVNANIQDVLSSVKRLVGENAHEESEFIFVPTAPAPKPGRLVLTDALRVSDEPLIADKPAPLKLMPQHSASGEVANTSGSSAEPMRLQPSDVVREGDASAKVTPSDTEPKRDLAGSLSAKIEALEAAIARTEDQWEPDGESDDDYSGTKTKSVQWPVDNGFAQSQTREAGAEPSATFVRDPEVVEDQASKPVASSFREEDLREIVAQIVREELQGALGERITRNLRKMVRREISRAMLAKDTE